MTDQPTSSTGTSTKIDGSEHLHDYELERVPDNKRRSLISVLLVWYGFIITPSALLVGSTIAVESTFSSFIIATAIGMLFAATYASITGIIGQRAGLSTYMCFRRFFGKRGSKLPGFIIYLTRVGWTAVEAGLVATVITIAFDIPIDANILAAMLVFFFVLTALFGYTGLDYLSKISIPLLFVAFLIAAASIIISEGWSGATAHVPEVTMPFTAKIGYAFAFWAAGATLAPDIVRYAKSDRDVVAANYLSLLPGTIFLFGLGAIVAQYTGEANPAISITTVGIASLGVLAIVFAGWTTCDSQYYSAGLAFSEMTNRPKAPLLIITAILTSAIALFGVHNYITGYLDLIGVFVPPIAGIFAAEYFILKNRYPKILEDASKITTNYNGAAIGAWLIGSVVGYFTPLVYIPPLASFVGATIAYLIFFKLGIYTPPNPDMTID